MPGEGNGMEGMGADVMGMGDIPMDPEAGMAIDPQLEKTAKKQRYKYNI